jgi:hypothetical protein
MQPTGIVPAWRLGVLLRGETESLRNWTEHCTAARLGQAVLIITVGGGLYGAAMGYWRDPRQALFVGAKFPLIIILTTLGNAALNAMLAPLLGLKASFTQSFVAITMNFTIAAAILGAFSPIMLFVVWNLPPMLPQSSGNNVVYSLIMLMHVGAIALAGTIANFRLLQLLRQLSGSPAVAGRVLCAWLAGNLFLGSQLCWILRPFIGSPDLPVQFLRQTAFQGNFYEAVFQSLLKVMNSVFH